MKALILLGLLLAPCAVMAQSEVCNSSITVNVVAVSTNATLIESAAIKMVGRKFVEYQNISTDTAHCSPSSGVTTTTGRLLTASGGTYSLSMDSSGYVLQTSTYTPFSTTGFNTSLTMYCVAAGSGGNGKVAITQCK